MNKKTHDQNLISNAQNVISRPKKIAIIGEGVIGCSTALQIAESLPKAQITIFHDNPFEKSCSAGPAGLFRIDDEKYREYGRETFSWLAKLHREKKGSETGVKLLSGHIQSDSRERLEQQERAYGDIVYNFRWLTDRERTDLFQNSSKYCIHYTAYASEGNLYVPYLKKLLINLGVKFEQRKIESLEQLGEESFDAVVNCAGLVAGKLAGDDDSVFPIRGVDAPWHKHFLYRDFSTFSIPKTDCVVLGSVKQEGRYETEITDEDRQDILKRYIELHPAMKEPKILREWLGLRPFRKEIRIEAVEKTTKSGKPYTIIHHYGHGGNGFTLGWGTAKKATKLLLDSLDRSSTVNRIKLPSKL
ncbi:unnamed protein product [Caenorhabditis auriculariae]|uniref:FAD dependent oxidoreductase domain-containing protein n=1 Tax=Caenorhabditis auriculariae TaxID=2777116 RepID=A0A8S1H8Z3_9PELO|nr:unnamed protein product [Caenorhabditis auriculariae]